MHSALVQMSDESRPLQTVSWMAMGPCMCKAGPCSLGIDIADSQLAVGSWMQLRVCGACKKFKNMSLPRTLEFGSGSGLQFRAIMSVGSSSTSQRGKALPNLPIRTLSSNLFIRNFFSSGISSMSYGAHALLAASAQITINNARIALPPIAPQRA